MLQSSTGIQKTKEKLSNGRVSGTPRQECSAHQNFWNFWIGHSDTVATVSHFLPYLVIMTTLRKLLTEATVSHSYIIYYQLAQGPRFLKLLNIVTKNC